MASTRRAAGEDLLYLLKPARGRPPAASASLSRQIGGIHFQDGDLHARATGTSAGKTAYTKAKGYFKKTA